MRLRRRFLHKEENEKELQITTVPHWRVEECRRCFDVTGRNMRYVSKTCSRALKLVYVLCLRYAFLPSAYFCSYLTSTVNRVENEQIILLVLLRVRI